MCGDWNFTALVWRPPVGSPQLAGITMQLVRAGLSRLGIPQVVRPVRLEDLTGVRSAFTTFSLGAGRPIASIDHHVLTPDGELGAWVTRAYESNPLEPI